MMANLLSERFGLVCHRVTKEFPGYEIIVAKKGIKLTPSVKSGDEPAEFHGVSDLAGTMRYKFTKTSMAPLTNRLSLMMRMKVPVVDKTGITGKFDFSLDVTMPPPASS
jgi:uncharacterized protein (TIGR03435 family)